MPPSDETTATSVLQPAGEVAHTMAVCKQWTPWQHVPWPTGLAVRDACPVLCPVPLWTPQVPAPTRTLGSASLVVDGVACLGDCAFDFDAKSADVEFSASVMTARPLELLARAFDSFAATLHLMLRARLAALSCACFRVHVSPVFKASMVPVYGLPHQPHDRSYRSNVKFQPGDDDIDAFNAKFDSAHIHWETSVLVGNAQRALGGEREKAACDRLSAINHALHSGAIATLDHPNALVMRDATSVAADMTTVYSGLCDVLKGAVRQASARLTPDEMKSVARSIRDAGEHWQRCSEAMQAIVALQPRVVGATSQRVARAIACLDAVICDTAMSPPRLASATVIGAMFCATPAHDPVPNIAEVPAVREAAALGRLAVSPLDLARRALHLFTRGVARMIQSTPWLAEAYETSVVQKRPSSPTAAPPRDVQWARAYVDADAMTTVSLLKFIEDRHGGEHDEKLAEITRGLVKFTRAHQHVAAPDCANAIDSDAAGRMAADLVYAARHICTSVTVHAKKTARRTTADVFGAPRFFMRHNCPPEIAALVQLSVLLSVPSAAAVAAGLSQQPIPSMSAVIARHAALATALANDTYGVVLVKTRSLLLHLRAILEQAQSDASTDNGSTNTKRRFAQTLAAAILAHVDSE